MMDSPSDFTTEKIPETLYKVRENFKIFQYDFNTFAAAMRGKVREIEADQNTTAAKVQMLSDRLQRVAAWSAGVSACLGLVLALLLSLGKLWVVDVVKPLIREEITRHEQMYEGKHPSPPNIERK